MPDLCQRYVWVSIHALLAESDIFQGPSLVRHGVGFYPRSPCGERPFRSPRIALMVGFLSTLSLRRATLTILHEDLFHVVSIHALLAESDLFALLCNLLHHSFYPRSPCGERLMDTLILANTMLFLSTLSLRRATTIMLYDPSALMFLSTLSLRRATIP